MKVSRAAHLISHEVSVGLKFLSEEQENLSFLTTSYFIGAVKQMV